MKEERKLSIVLASSYAFTEEPGGVKDFILGLRTALQRQGCEVFVVAPGSKDALKKGEIDFVLGTDFKISADQTEFRASFSRKETAGEILKAIKPEIIVIHEPFMPSIGHTLISSVARSKGRRPIVIGQFHASKKDISWPFKAVEFIGRHIIRRPELNGKTILGFSSGYVPTINDNLDGRIAVSRTTKRFWQRNFPAEYKVIYNGINTNELRPDPTSPFGLRGARKIILFAGRHDSRKGIDDLINAVNILVSSGNKDIRLKIAGVGEMTKILQGMVKKLNLQGYVQFIGVLPREELVKAYRTADLLVAPSTGGEGFNRTIIEARSCGTLVVCTDIGGQNEAIGEDLTPFMARPKNPHSLAKQILAVLNLPLKKKQEISQRGREEVKKNFDWNKIASEHLNYYKKMINDKGLSIN